MARECQASTAQRQNADHGRGVWTSPPNKRLNPVQFIRQLSAGHFCVIGSLGPQPIARAQPEAAAEPQIGVCGDGALAGNDLADAGGWNTDRLGQTSLADAKRLEEVFCKQFTRCDGREAIHEREFIGH